MSKPIQLSVLQRSQIRVFVLLHIIDSSRKARTQGAFMFNERLENVYDALVKAELTDELPKHIILACVAEALQRYANNVGATFVYDEQAQTGKLTKTFED